RALPRDHPLVLEGVHERGAGLLREAPGLRERLLEGCADEHRFAAVADAGLHLGHGRVLRHVDGRAGAEVAGRGGDGLPVVARARAGATANPSAARFRRRHSSSRPAPSRWARCAPIFSQRASIPSSRSASVSTTGGCQSPPGPRLSTCCTSFTIVWASGWSSL